MKLVLVKCKNCGKSAPSDEFRIDHINKRMVCPSCSRFIKKEGSVQVAPEPPKKKLDGWLERYREHKTGIISDNKDKIRIKCFKCDYNFNFNKITKVPKKCPYCAYDVDSSIKGF